jgi:hypothetical protein
MRKVTVGLVTVSPCDGASMKMCWAKDSAGASTAAIKSARWQLVFMAKPPLSGRFTNCARDVSRPESEREVVLSPDNCSRIDQPTF